MITGDADVGVDHDAKLLAFADAAIHGQQAELTLTWQRVVASLGVAAMVDAAAIIAVFSGITRIADATGIPVEDRKLTETQQWRGALGIDRYMEMKS